MNNTTHTFKEFLIYLAVMAVVTYLIRLLPMLCIRKKIENRFIRSVLFYMPYSVLTVMTIPAIFYATTHLLTGIVATIVAVTLAYFQKNLITVASGAAITVLLFEMIFTVI